MGIAKKDFDELRAAGKLPSPTGVALRLMELTRKEDVAIEEIAKTVRADPALTGRLIKFANSALMGSRNRPVAAAAEAIQRIGLSTVRHLVLGFSVMGAHRNGACLSFDYSRFWSRGLATAIAANAFCLRTGITSAEEAFTCGLLSDVGSLALASLYPKEFAGVIDATRNVPLSQRAEMERKQLGVDHNELCAALLEDWRLPKLFVDAVLHHEAPELSPAPAGSRERSMTKLISVAAKVGNYCVATAEGRKAKILMLVSDAAHFGLDDQALAPMVDQVAADWVEWGKILEVRTNDLGTFSKLAAAAAESAPQVVRAPEKMEPLDILVADDDKNIREILEQILTREGHRVLVAENGKSALAMAVDRNPQLVISDWIMPDMTGPEICRSLRQTEQGAGMYFVLITSLGHEDEVTEAFEAGVDDYLTKPFNPKVLTARLRASTRAVHLRDEVQKGRATLDKMAAELALSNRRLQQMTLIDMPTGLPSRRQMLELAAKECEASIQNRTPLSLMVVDIDSLRQVNHSYGCACGEEVLRHVAEGLRQWARAGDAVGRLGGDTFMVICPGADLSTTMLLADRMRQAVANLVMKIEGAAIRVTISVGVAEHRQGDAGFENTLHAGEVALRRAKELGRNRVQVAGNAGNNPVLH
jgi:two-component system, cell cycle response regulator